MAGAALGLSTGPGSPRPEPLAVGTAARPAIRRRLARHRSFDPRVVGRLECDAWVAYYRREWLTFLVSGITLSRRVFSLSWPATLRCSWLILRANQLWAPATGNDVDRAQAAMERFYRIVARLYDEPFDPARAAALEVEWWRVHREDRPNPGGEFDVGGLADALARLYAHVYGVSEAAVLLAAQQRALAMRVSDQWVREGCRADSELIDQERAALVRSYAALLAVIHQV